MNLARLRTSINYKNRTDHTQQHEPTKASSKRSVKQMCPNPGQHPDTRTPTERCNMQLSPTRRTHRTVQPIRYIALKSSVAKLGKVTRRLSSSLPSPSLHTHTNRTNMGSSLTCKKPKPDVVSRHASWLVVSNRRKVNRTTQCQISQ